MNARPTPDKRLGEIAGLIRRARLDLQEGEPVDLGSLDATVAALCEAVTELPKDQAQALKPRLVALKDDLDTLEEVLQRSHEAVTDELRRLSSRAQALSAYGRPSKK